MYTVYGIYSPQFNKIYIGQTNDLDRRITEHNNGVFAGYTKRFIPWEIVYTENIHTRSEALKRKAT